MGIKKRNILFISPKTFGYEKDIEDAIRSDGNNVYYFDERPFNSSLGKIVLRLNLSIFSKHWIDNYYRKILVDISSVSIDVVFLLIPESVPNWFLEEIKEINVNTKIVIYMWDSVRNRKSIYRLRGISDVVYSFDRNDCSEYEDFEFLPLFYTDDYLRVSNSSGKKYDFCFVGTVHSDRCKMVQEMTKSGLNNYIYWYCPSKLLYFLKKVFTKEFDSLALKDVMFEPLTKKQFSKIMHSSRVVVDIQHPEQTGLTMRSIEALAVGSKLITTNKDIVNYDFYDSNNCCVFERSEGSHSMDLLSKKYRSVSSEIVESYSISSWVKKVLK